MKSFDILIVGGGCSATLLLLQLSKSAAPGTRVGVIDKSTLRSRGIAYRTKSARHLLNVPAARMSAFPQTPSDFCAWLETKGKAYGKFEFVPRWTFGDYLEQRLEEAQTASVISIEWLETAATNVTPVRRENTSGYEVALERGEAVFAPHCVLAVGTPAAEWPSGFKESSAARQDIFICDPWHETALKGSSTLSSVCILGTGLTAADAVLELAADTQPKKIVMLSRHGRLSEAHKPELFHEPALAAPLLPLSLRQTVRWIRESSLTTDWRRAVDALRPITAQLWKSFSLFEKRQFLRHLRCYWDVLRHRMAPQIRDKLEELRAKGVLEIVAGRISKVEIQGNECLLVFKDRHGMRQEHRAQRVINCTGFGNAAPPGSLLSNLEGQGLLKRSAIGFGFETDHARAPGLFLMGSIRNGELWESIAVPELRQQALLIAEGIASAQAKVA
jgi:uncharacterized NAD(P)/FAD-binding protein YdhS